MSEFLIELTAALERINGRVAALEKSLDANTATAAASTLAAQASAAALTRIAAAEEARVAQNVQEAKDRKEMFANVWKSRVVQTLLVGLMIVILNALGLSWYVERVLPTPH